jgi:DNA polymerase-3 subunit epsilon
MQLEREVWASRAEAVGLVVLPSVTKKADLLVAADCDSLSGKARKAAAYGVPVVDEATFARWWAAL